MRYVDAREVLLTKRDLVTRAGCRRRASAVERDVACRRRGSRAESVTSFEGSKPSLAVVDLLVLEGAGDAHLTLQDAHEVGALVDRQLLSARSSAKASTEKRAVDAQAGHAHASLGARHLVRRRRSLSSTPAAHEFSASATSLVETFSPFQRKVSPMRSAKDASNRRARACVIRSPVLKYRVALLEDVLEHLLARWLARRDSRRTWQHVVDARTTMQARSRRARRRVADAPPRCAPAHPSPEIALHDRAAPAACRPTMPGNAPRS